MKPLAERMRPQSLDDYVGQRHLVAPGAVLRRAIESGNVPSMIFWGPPGVGKTTLARIMSNSLNRAFYTLSAVSSGVKDVRETIKKAESGRFFDRKMPILFIDEIHRFSKSQQDSLLGAVENGTVTLVGATTENPSFEVISALLSRCQVYVLKHLEEGDLLGLLGRALEKDMYLSKKNIDLSETNALVRYSGGDARRLLNILELVVNALDDGEGKPIRITDEAVGNILQDTRIGYDKGGDQHYDIASALIKSIRGSDPNAAVYYLARMLEGGEDVKFIARRLVIAASEDIGLANPNALLMAQTCFASVSMVGMPESRIILSQCAIYLATSPKSNASYLAIKKAQQLVKETGALPVPLHLRNAPTHLMKKLGHGKDYKYAHDYPGHFVEQQFLPDKIAKTKLYEPAQNPSENKLRERLKRWWQGRYKY